jgi:uncharacterized protein (TIGR02453 family)
MEENYLKPVLDFLSELAQHNRRDWFKQHQDVYQAARKRFEDFVDELIIAYRAVEDLGPLTAHDCVMRIYRDLRFTRDKTPYQTHMAASIAKGGRHSPRFPYYLHIAPHDQSFLAGGLYMTSGSQLARFREQVDRDSAPLRAIFNDSRFYQVFGAPGGESLKTAPQGYSRDHPDIDLLRLKQVTVSYPLPDALVLSPTIIDHVVEIFTVMKPFLDYLNETVAA